MGGNTGSVLSIHARDEHALSARREYLTKDGQIQGGPDHYARLAATKHYRDFLMASRPAPKQPEEKDKRLTLPELEAMLRANKELQDPAHTD
jgi:integrase